MRNSDCGMMRAWLSSIRNPHSAFRNSQAPDGQPVPLNGTLLRRRPLLSGRGLLCRTPRPSATPSPQSKKQPTSAGEEVDENDVVRIETQLVSVPAIVTDAAGRPVTGLRADNFQIYEDGRPQKIANFATTEAPFEVALLLDTSGSTRAEVGLIRRAALAFIEALRPGDRVAVIEIGRASCR